MNMSAFIAMMVIRSVEINEEAGKEKYRAYFVNTHIYKRYQDDTDTILETEGCSKAIVRY